MKKVAKPLSDLNQLPLGELFSAIMNARSLETLIDLSMGEDLALRGDVTSMLMIRPNTTMRAAVVARQAGVLSGVPLLSRIAAKYDSGITVRTHFADGASLQPGSVIAEIEGDSHAILAAERVMLNFLSHLSGIATLTALFADAILGEKARIFDTRKTVPGFRRLSKYAVRCGGGFCHRIGLHDAVLIKDNHLGKIAIDHLERAIAHAIARARRFDPQPEFVEVEVDGLDQLQAVLPCDVDIVLLDNFSPAELKKAVELRDRIHSSVQLEASGGVTLDTVGAVAASGVDRIAIGAMTHSAPALDIGLDYVA